MRWFTTDLHIHSVLSPCGGLEMSPVALMKRAQDLKIDWIAITDHNSMANCPAYEKVAGDFGIAFTWGVEIQTAEEIHLLAYFDNNSQAQEFDKLLYGSLLPLQNDADFFGDQVVIDENENIIKLEERALINSSLWGIDEAVEMIRSYDGYCMPAHIDATANSIISQLGFIPNPELFDAFGITAKCDVDAYKKQIPYLKTNSLIRSSDAHYLADMGSGWTKFFIETPVMEEIMLSVSGTDGRLISI